MTFEEELRDELHRHAGAIDPPLAPVTEVLTTARGRLRRHRALRNAGAVSAVVALVAGGLGVHAVLGGEGVDRVVPATSHTETPNPPPTTERPVDATPSTAPPTPAGTTTTAAATSLKAGPLIFTADTIVRGRSVTFAGFWSGTASTLTGANIAGDPAPSTGERPGSGLEGWDYALTLAGVGPGDPDFAMVPSIVAQTNGDITACTGPVVPQHRDLPPRTLTLQLPGTYTVTMVTDYCGGQRTESWTFTMPASAFATPSAQ